MDSASFVSQFKEIHGWGWNGLTASFLCTVAFTFVQAYGLLLQIIRIYRERSASSVAVPMMWYLCFYFVAFGVYGFHERSIAMLFNSLLSFLHVPVLVGIVKYRGMTRAQWVFAACSLLPIVAMIFLEQKDVVFFVGFLVAIVLIAEQPFEIWRQRAVGAVEVRTYNAYIVSTTCWLVYGVVVGDWVIMVLNPVLLIIFMLTIWLCRLHGKPTTERKVVK